MLIKLFKNFEIVSYGDDFNIFLQIKIVSNQLKSKLLINKKMLNIGPSNFTNDSFLILLLSFNF